MLRAFRWPGVVMLGSVCAFASLPAAPAGDAEPTPLKEFDKLPVGLKVTHDPLPSRATENAADKSTAQHARSPEFCEFDSHVLDFA
jgi:hypothetical protein